MLDFNYTYKNPHLVLKTHPQNKRWLRSRDKHQNVTVDGEHESLNLFERKYCESLPVLSTVKEFVPYWGEFCELDKADDSELIKLMKEFNHGYYVDVDGPPYVIVDHKQTGGSIEPILLDWCMRVWFNPSIPVVHDPRITIRGFA